MANEAAERNEAWKKGVRVEVDNIDAGKMEDRKDGKQVVRTGKLAQLVKNRKKQAAK
ncbi:hypothetical protein Tco_1137606, partial [Tanacetum coccineum]